MPWHIPSAITRNLTRKSFCFFVQKEALPFFK
jgi:hypothetical protein